MSCFQQKALNLEILSFHDFLNRIKALCSEHRLFRFLGLLLLVFFR